MENMDTQPHLMLRKGQVQPVVLTVGDPKRVDSVAALCESYEELADNREYRSVNVVYKGCKITVISHGIGVPGAMICFEELIKLGAKVIIRAGTCGSLKPRSIQTGDIYVPYAVARDSDITDQYVPLGMPAVATPHVYQTLVKAGEDLGIPLHTGVSLCNGLFYGYGSGHIEHLRKWGELADIVEMELQALLLVGAARKIATGGVAAVDGSPLEWDQNNYDAHGEKCRRAKENTLRVALEACSKLCPEFRD